MKQKARMFNKAVTFLDIFAKLYLIGLINIREGLFLDKTRQIRIEYESVLNYLTKEMTEIHGKSNILL